MNAYKKYCPNVYLAECDSEHEKGEIIPVTTKYGKENDCIVHNLIIQRDGKYYYSITRNDGMNSRERAKRKLERIQSWIAAADRHADEWMSKAEEGSGFLSLGEPIKVGHHSEQRHRALIERNNNRMRNAMAEKEKVENYAGRLAYWDKMVEKIDLSMPESLEYYELQLNDATKYHAGLKNGSIEREHDYTLQYATRRVNDLKKKLEIAEKLWGE